MADMKAAARTAMAAKLIADVVTAEHKPVKAGLLDEMITVGVERVGVVGSDGVKLGTVSLTQGSRTARVNDDRAFLAWVAERYPGEVVQVVRDSFARMLLDGAASANAPVDRSTGEVIPGVEISVGEPHLTVRPEAGARERMRETLLTSGLLQLPAGGAE